MIETLLAPLHPNEDALTPVFQANVDDEMLREIAEADYGEGATECHALLRETLCTGRASPRASEGQLREVLSLIHWGPRSCELRGC